MACVSLKYLQNMNITKQKKRKKEGNLKLKGQSGNHIQGKINTITDLKDILNEYI